MKILSAVLASALAASAASAQVPALMVVDSGADRVMLFSKVDGSLIDANWITDADAVGWVFTTPKEAISVGSEVWVSDQVADAIHRFDAVTREYVGSITTMPSGALLDNIRGMGFDGTTVYLTQFHGTTTNRGVVMFATDGTPVGFFPVPTSSWSWFDVEPFEGDLLISSSSTNDVRRYTTDGAPVSVFAPGITFAQQVSRQADGSIITVASIAAAGVEGVYHFNADGTLRRFIDTENLKQHIGEQVPRGAYQLDDGGYLIATDRGVYKAVEVSEGFFSFEAMFAGADAQFINPLEIGGTGCPVDWNGDGDVNSSDISAFLTGWLASLQDSTLDADFNDDLTVNSSDISAFLTAWLQALTDGC